jgi:prepilin-type processing-associated H-X9-DG protein
LLGEPAPDNVLRTARVFRCPANSFQSASVASGAAQKTFYGVIIEGDLGLPWNPYGYPAVEVTWNPGQPPHRISELTEIRSLSELWTLVDVDQAAPGFPGWRETTPKTPAHGRTRNYLFFDGHVAGHRLVGNGSYSAPFAR